MGRDHSRGPFFGRRFDLGDDSVPEVDFPRNRNKTLSKCMETSRGSRPVVPLRFGNVRRSERRTMDMRE